MNMPLSPSQLKLALAAVIHLGVRVKYQFMDRMGSNGSIRHLDIETGDEDPICKAPNWKTRIASPAGTVLFDQNQTLWQNRNKASGRDELATNLRDIEQWATYWASQAVEIPATPEQIRAVIADYRLAGTVDWFAIIRARASFVQAGCYGFTRSSLTEKFVGYRVGDTLPSGHPAEHDIPANPKATLKPLGEPCNYELLYAGLVNPNDTNSPVTIDGIVRFDMSFIDAELFPEHDRWLPFPADATDDIPSDDAAPADKDAPSADATEDTPSDDADASDSKAEPTADADDDLPF